MLLTHKVLCEGKGSTLRDCRKKTRIKQQKEVFPIFPSFGDHLLTVNNFSIVHGESLLLTLRKLYETNYLMPNFGFYINLLNDLIADLLGK